MRIVYVSMDPGIPVFGPKGASNHIREFVGALAGEGHDVNIVAARKGRGARPFGCQIHIPAKPEADEQYSGVAAREIGAIFRNRSLEETLARLHADSPVDLILERYSLWSHGALDFAVSRNIPFVLEVNSPLRQEQSAYRDLELDPVAQVIESSLFRSATVVAGVSRKIADYVIERSNRRAPTVVLPNGVDPKLFEEQPTAVAGRPFTIGFVGSLKPWHGIEQLLEAFGIVRHREPGVRLRIVGDGPMRELIEAYGRTRGISEEIELTGAVEKEAIPGHLALMDVAVAPYPEIPEFYFSPLKLFEYMAAGRAIVASRIGQVAGTIRHRQTGLLVDPGQPTELAEGILELLRNPGYRRALGAAARREALQRHCWKHRVDTLLAAVPEFRYHAPALPDPVFAEGPRAT